MKKIDEDLKIEIGEQPIKRVDDKKVLGVIINEQMKWNKHVDKQCKEISKNIALLRRAKQFVRQETLQTLYKSFVLPHFTYCSTLWHDGNESNFKKLLKLRKRAARVITGSNYEITSVELFNSLHWDTIKQVLNGRQIIMMYKALNELLPEHISRYFIFCNNSSYDMHSNERKLYLPKPKTNFVKKKELLPITTSIMNFKKNFTNISIGQLKRRLLEII